ncbi:hypothetical protein ABFS83_04G221900 [Erythranthe nasuta]
MEVYKRLVGELEEMGFSKAIATKAICSGNSSIEDAINWLVEHENDTADNEPQTPMAEVLVDVNIEESDGFHISEDVKLRAKELRNQARKRKAELERKLEREREKERIRAGKELLEAKRMAEESERKRFLSQNKAEKDEERRARENIRQKLQQDKLERREMLGLPREAPVPVKVKPETAEPQITKKLEPVDPGLSPVKLAAVRDNMRECLRSIKRQNKDDNAKAMRAFKTLLIYVTNIFNDPDKDKLRKIRISNPLFQEKVGKFEEGIEFLELCGFERVDGGLGFSAEKKNCKSPFHKMYADQVESRANRSVKDRLNGNSASNSGRRRPISGKRQREDDDKWEHDLFEDSEPQVTNRKVGVRDLRFKLQRKSIEQANPSARDLREKLSGTFYSRPIESKPIPVRPKPALEVSKPPRKVATSVSKKKVQQKVESVDSFLQSLSLEKYSITFQAEEVDMAALVHMKDEDLKVLGIPMGPRKKILLALESKSHD